MYKKKSGGGGGKQQQYTISSKRWDKKSREYQQKVRSCVVFFHKEMKAFIFVLLLLIVASHFVYSGVFFFERYYNEYSTSSFFFTCMSYTVLVSLFTLLYLVSEFLYWLILRGVTYDQTSIRATREVWALRICTPILTIVAIVFLWYGYGRLEHVDHDNHLIRLVYRSFGYMYLTEILFGTELIHFIVISLCLHGYFVRNITGVMLDGELKRISR